MKENDMNSTIDNHVFNFVFGIALNDAMNRVADYDEKDKHKVAQNSGIRNVVKKYAEDIVGGKKPDFYRAVLDIQKANENDNEHRINCLSFGKAQKLINMTMKYLYIRYVDTDKEMHYEDCHAPMDSIMMDLIYYYLKGKKKEIHFHISHNWSSLEMDATGENDDYIGFQQDIQSVIGDKCSRIRFDYELWEKAKALRPADFLSAKEKQDKAIEIIDAWKQGN